MAPYEQPRVPSAPRYTAIINVCQDYLKSLDQACTQPYSVLTRPLIKMVYMGGERWRGFSKKKKRCYRTKERLKKSTETPPWRRLRLLSGYTGNLRSRLGNRRLARIAFGVEKGSRSSGGLLNEKKSRLITRVHERMTYHDVTQRSQSVTEELREIREGCWNWQFDA
jgi:hypothetical protein